MNLYYPPHQLSLQISLPGHQSCGGATRTTRSRWQHPPGHSRPLPESRRPGSPGGQRRKNAPRRVHWNTCTRDQGHSRGVAPGTGQQCCISIRCNSSCCPLWWHASSQSPANVALLRDARLDGPPVLVAVERVDGHDVWSGLIASNCRARCGRWDLARAVEHSTMRLCPSGINDAKAASWGRVAGPGCCTPAHDLTGQPCVICTLRTRTGPAVLRPGRLAVRVARRALLLLLRSGIRVGRWPAVASAPACGWPAVGAAKAAAIPAWEGEIGRGSRALRILSAWMWWQQGW